MINRPSRTAQLDLLGRLAGAGRDLVSRVAKLERALNPTLATSGPPRIWVSATDPAGAFAIAVQAGDVWIKNVAAGGVYVRSVSGTWTSVAT